MEVAIQLASVRDAEQILALQRLCYQTEAELYADWSIPPLTETLQELRRAYEAHTILAAHGDGKIVGSVRGRMGGDTCHVGRLVVHPRLRRRGLGMALMEKLEASFPDAARFELFTGHLSEGNLRLYRRLGYRESREEAVSRRLRLVYLEKRRAPGP